MVHALDEVKRVLGRGGLLVDLRPVVGGTPVEVVSSRATQQAGALEQIAEDRAHDEAADEAVEESIANGWFHQVRSDSFTYAYYFDAPSELEAFIADDWEGVVSLAPEVWRRVRALWAVADADARLRIPLRMVMRLLRNR